MKITVISGSPATEGNTDKMTDLLLLGFKGHDIKRFRINDLQCKGCQACGECEKSDNIVCAQKDELQPVIDRLAESDLLCIASPIYMDQVTAQTRIFQDRLNVFLRKDFSSKLKRTPAILLYAQAIEDKEHYQDYFKTLKKVYGKFNIDVVDTIVLGNAQEHEELGNDIETMKILENWATINEGRINLCPTSM